MPTVDELSKKFDELNTSVGTMKKDFELKLASANKEAEDWKKVAAKNAEDLKKFQETAEKDKTEKEKAYAELRRNENKTFLEGLKKAGKLTPAMQESAEKLMESMTSDTVVHTFEARDGKKTNHTQLSLFKELLSSFSASPIFRHMSPATQTKEGTPTGSEEKTFATVKTKEGVQTYEIDGLDLDAAAKEYQQEQAKLGKTVEYAEALIHAEKVLKQAA